MTPEIDHMISIQATIVANALRQAARRGGTEADFRREVARILEDAGSKAGLTVIPRDEFSVARGRVDSVYNRLILEYKKPGILKKNNSSTGNKAVIQQVKDYILDVAKKERREAHRLAGIAIDGFYLIFVRRVGEGWIVDDPIEVTPYSTERFLRLLFSLSVGAALVPENLVDDFGPQNLRARRAARALYAALYTCKHPLVAKLFDQWQLFFSEVTDYKEWAASIEAKPEFQSFVSSIWTKGEIHRLDPARVFFVLHTYYALLIKLVASMAAARFTEGSVNVLTQMVTKKGDQLRDAFKDLEAGGIFKTYGIRNFLEGDFFGWYLAAWNEEIEEAVSTLVHRLAEYDPGTLELAPENARDLLKKLYHYLLPRDIRHDLGEYYTPDWLAERLIIQTLGQADLGDATKRVLDPACGSGTFLVILIKYIRERAARKGQDPTKTLSLILQNVVGIDLNPLAVIAARTNYLLALGDLLKARKGDIDIPVYQADSVLTPSQGSCLFDGDIYPLKTSVGVFRIPSIFAERGRMDALANALDEAVEDRIGEHAFLKRVQSYAAMEEEELKATEQELKELFRQLRNLHDQGLNGVWARIIKNAFAPLFIEPSHYIVGNPPWVNWESLPDDYRLQTKSLWEHYGLFPHGGMDTILGKGKKDISMLMTYVSVDRYLRRGGKLGFVLSQSLFKTSGAGQGFRRFLLPDKTPFGPLIVEDMLELKPFEGATNRTVVAVFPKGLSVRYPVSYSYWKKKTTGRGSAIAFDTPYEEVTKEKVTFRSWQAVPVSQSDNTSAWITARPKALRALRNVLGNSQYSAHAGSFTGGANGIFWVEVTGLRPGGLTVITNITEGARRRVSNVHAAIETDLIYPLIRGRDVNRWTATPSAHIIIVQDPHSRRGIAPNIMELKYPKTLSYLSRFESILRSRAAFRRYYRETDPYWSMFNISVFTLSPWKVVWREQSTQLAAAVIGPFEERPVIPDHKLMMVDVETQQEGHYLCALLDSSPTRLAVAAYAVSIQMDTHILNNISIPKFSKKNNVHVLLSELSNNAHIAVSIGNLSEVKSIECEIDLLAAKIWGLSDDELAEIKQSLEDM